MIPPPRSASPRFRSALLLGLAAALVSLVPEAHADRGRVGQVLALQATMDALVAAGMPGVAVALREGRRERFLTSGVADVGTGTELTPDTRFRIGSVSKAFNGALVLSVVRDGLLGLDDTVAQHAPGLLAHGGEITVRQMLGHTSGLRSFTEIPAFLDLLLADLGRVWDPLELVAFIADEDLLFEPGSEYRYSNTDNLVLAVLVESVTGQPYASELARRVLRPLDLRATIFPTTFDLPTPHASGYDWSAGDGEGVLEDTTSVLHPSALSASGALVSTPRDLARFISGVLAGRVYGPRLLREARRTVPGDSDPAGPPGAGTNDAGLALFRYRLPCGTAWGHTGQIVPGWRGFAAASPDGRRAVSVLVNGSNVNATARALLLQAQEQAVCLALGGLAPVGKRGDRS